MLEAPLLGEGTVLRLERDAWSMVKLPRHATNESPPPPPPLLSIKLKRKWGVVFVFESSRTKGCTFWPKRF